MAKISIELCSAFVSCIKANCPNVNLGNVIRAISAAINSSVQLDAIKEGKQSARVAGTKDKRTFQLSQGQTMVYTGKLSMPARIMALNTWFDNQELALAKIILPTEKENVQTILESFPLPANMRDWMNARSNGTVDENVNPETVETNVS